MKLCDLCEFDHEVKLYELKEYETSSRTYWVANMCRTCLALLQNRSFYELDRRIANSKLLNRVLESGQGGQASRVVQGRETQEE